MEGMKLKPSQIYREASNVWRDTEDWSKALGMEVRLITLNFNSCSYSTIGETYLWRKYEWYNLVKATQGQEQADREVAPVTMIKLAEDFNLTPEEYESLAQIELILNKKHPVMFCAQSGLAQYLVQRIDQIQPEYKAIQCLELIWNDWFVYDPSNASESTAMEVLVKEASTSASEISALHTKSVFMAFTKFWEVLVKWKLRKVATLRKSATSKMQGQPKPTTTYQPLFEDR